ncbi:hypothetical protein ENUP19_0118G0038 [Entamoeba nuttalli]|uniref:Ras-GEF domain-containing protein n=2 Tax=Entamoeba nuttalli TaxID=412467 RepID=K2GU05_ENTNP|nr:hypothetical protein ENU1_163660 [Entamoeba nuttalli P19]EKE38518.1 hypothetical protein ENU1_163660 [Entamoeba nuttalli P19]|eukprot:XP_008859146.1 hypothetical protein ENU1_163660 [Entamoeba nuttalli P19]
MDLEEVPKHPVIVRPKVNDISRTIQQVSSNISINSIVGTTAQIGTSFLSLFKLVQQPIDEETVKSLYLSSSYCYSSFWEEKKHKVTSEIALVMILKGSNSIGLRFVLNENCIPSLINEEQTIISLRIFIWTMEKTHRECLLKWIQMIDRLEEGEIKEMTLNQLFICFCCEKEKEKIQSLYQALKDSITVFEPEAGDPLFYDDEESEQSLLMAASVQTMFQFVFNNTLIESNFIEHFAIFSIFIIDPLLFIEYLEKITCNLEDEISSNQLSLLEQNLYSRRLYSLFRGWLEMHAEYFSRERPFLLEKIKRSKTIKYEGFNEQERVVINALIGRARSRSPLMSPSLHEINEGKLNMPYKSIKEIKEMFEEYKNYKHSNRTVKHVINDKIRLQFAQQLTLFDQAKLRSIKLYEIITKKEHCYSIDSYSKFISKLGDLVSSIITSNSLERIKNEKFFIRLTLTLVKLGNFNVASTIFSSLHVAINDVDFNKLSKELQNDLVKLRSLFSLTSNYKRYREVYNKSNYPKLPILFVWMGDLFHTNELPVMFDEEKKLVNVKKIRSLGRIILSIRDAQTISFHFSPLPTVQSWLMKL